jgi:hypothetical protein
MRPHAFLSQQTLPHSVVGPSMNLAGYQEIHEVNLVPVAHTYNPCYLEG